MKYLSEEIIKYMDTIWGFNSSDCVDDLRMFWESDYPELTAKRLVDGGAVEPNCKEAKEMIKVANSIDFKTELKIIKKVTKDYTALECSNCNYVHFIPQYCNTNDWIDGKCDGCLKKGYVRVLK